MKISVEQIGDQIKKFRELRNYTQDWLAKALEMSTQGYGKIERNDTDITLKKLHQIAVILGTTIQDILGFEDKYVFNNQENNGCSLTGDVNNLNNLQEFQKIYEGRIEGMQKEIDWLREMLQNK